MLSRFKIPLAAAVLLILVRCPCGVKYHYDKKLAKLALMPQKA